MRWYRLLLPIAILSLAVLGLSRGQAPAPPTPAREAREEIRPEVLELLRARLAPRFANWGPDYVVDRCAEHLATINELDRPRIRYFDLSAVPRELLPQFTSALLFGVNSTHLVPAIKVPQPVPETDNRIFWIDLAWYNWTVDAWSHMGEADWYIREPIVDSHSKALTLLRAYGPGDQVLRGDWWLYYTFDTTLFLAKDEVKADDAFYYRLLFGKDKIPQTAQDFEKLFKVDFSVLKDFSVDMGAVIDEGDSQVSYSNRVLWRVRTAAGVYWRTYDVFRTAGDQDFIEHPFPREYDAGEHIFQFLDGRQIYLLTNGQGKRVEFGDPRLVKDTVSGGAREPLIVCTARGCIHCHDNGIIDFKNAMLRLEDAAIPLISPDLRRKERFQQFFLQREAMKRAVKQDQENYAAFVFSCNGLTPQQNAAQFSFVRGWYSRPVDLEQAARELGCEPIELRDALGLTSTKGRLREMAHSLRPMPRLTWERGGFAEAGLALLVHRGKIKMEEMHRTMSGVRARAAESHASGSPSRPVGKGSKTSPKK